MRVKSIVLLIIMALSINVKAQEIADWWNDVTVCEVNRVSPRTNVIPYEDEKGIYNLDYRQSPYYQCLNGEWKFNAIGSGYQGGLEALCANYGVDVE